MADENVNPTRDQFEKLECPFKWITKNIIQEDEIDYHLDDDEDLFPLLQLMRCIMTVYVDTKFNADSAVILKELEKCDEIMLTIKENEHPEISTDIVNYVLCCTKCFVYKQLNLPEKLSGAFSEIIQDWTMNNKEKSTLIACRSICWSKYHRMGNSEAELFMRDALKENPNCELWYFILGKNLRRKRRDSTISELPSAEEMSCFKKAYNMSKNPVFGIFLAQMYREMRTKIDDAKRIYNHIYDQNPTSTTILLRLALGFIRLKNFERAKKCLDKVEAVSPNHSMYLHYRGIYFMNLRDYRKAEIYLKKAGKDNCIPAEKQYLDCAVKLNRSFNVVEYLRKMVSKYSRLPEAQRQPMLVDLAVAYWIKNNDIPNTIKYFIEAVEINPEAKCFTNYFSPEAFRIKEKNLYRLLKTKILPIVRGCKDRFEPSCIGNAEKLQDYCNQNFDKNLDNALDSFSRLNVRA